MYVQLYPGFLDATHEFVTSVPALVQHVYVDAVPACKQATITCVPHTHIASVA